MLLLKNANLVKELRGCTSRLLLQASKQQRSFQTDHRLGNRSVETAKENPVRSAEKPVRPESSGPQASPKANRIGLKWKLLAFTAGFGVSAYLLDKYYLRKNHEVYIEVYKMIPLRSISRAWGQVNSIDLPVWARKPLYRFYTWVFNCKLNECEIEDISEYKNLSEFFRRGLKPDCRAINQQCCLSSPCDGKILHFGQVEDGHLEQIKGVTYSLKAFLGKPNWPRSGAQAKSNQEEAVAADYEKTVLANPNSRLYSCIIYLAPGDYHRFHSPVDWSIHFRRHFPGELFSVSPGVAGWLKGLFSLNERVVYYGQWKYGFFAMSAVGATNVGSIRIYFDEELKTNALELEDKEEKLDKLFSTRNPKNNKELLGKAVKRGDAFGEFNLGSTIVLVFEAPKDFGFSVSPGEKVLFGQKLGSSLSACKKA